MTKLQTKESLLDSTLILRPVQWTDAETVAKLIYDVCEAEGDVTVAVTPEELKHEWQDSDFNVETDALLVQTKDGRVVGYEEFVNEHAHSRLRFDGYVHPEFKGHSIGTSMLRALEVRAREEIARAEPDVRVFIHSTIDIGDEPGSKLHEAEGFHPARYHYRMEITLDAPPPAPVWPEGLELRPFIGEQHERAVWQAQNESFHDHWGSHDVSFEDFVHSRFDDPEFNPSLWAIAWDGDEVSGISLNRYRMGIGWIRTLGVRRPWRKKGLGLAMLHYSFGEFYKRGTKTIGLGVDASNPTGATRLYQRAGMHIANEFVTYEKELRPGRDLDEE